MDGLDLPLVPAHLTSQIGAWQRIRTLQDQNGAIPWFEEGPWDPWNHTESAMALTAMGDVDAALAAFDYLLRTQRPDGAWFGDYGNALPMSDRNHISREKAPAFLDTNFIAYPAVGLYHYFLATRDRDEIARFWPMVQDALDFVLSLQRPDGAIIWAYEAVGTPDEDALLAGNASIAKSLSCALALAQAMGETKPNWEDASARLMQALRSAPGVFDRSGKGRRFAMDWYYPVLSGALPLEQSARRIHARWNEFVDPDRGCLCVLDEPWVTVAESCELVLALMCIGNAVDAASLFEKATQICNADGVYWMGWQSDERIVWPQEQPSWTQAAVILAADALWGTSPHSHLLVTHDLGRFPTKLHRLAAWIFRQG